MTLKLKELLWVYTIEIKPKFNPSLDVEHYNHIGYNILAKSEKLALLKGVLQIPGYVTMANPSAGGFALGTRRTFALVFFQNRHLSMSALYPYCCR